MSQNVTIDEVFRLLTLTREEHGRVLVDIREQVTATNGRVNQHEERLRNHDFEIRDLKQELRTAAAGDGEPVAATKPNPDAEPGITKRDLKVICAVLVVLQAIFEWGPRVMELLGGQP